MSRSRFSLVALGVAALTGASLGLLEAPAVACSTSQRVVTYVEFANGSSEPVDGFEARLLSRMIADVPAGMKVTSYSILASGDIGQGADWQAAAPDARKADLALGQARVARLRAMLNALPKAMRSKHVEVTIQEGRQLFTDEQKAKNSALTESLRAGIVAHVWPDVPPPKKGEPVPVC